MKFRQLFGVFILDYLVGAVAAQDECPEPPPSSCTGFSGLNIDSSSISVSGISAGGAMATQLHVAHSNIIMGCGIFAGPGPYYCAESSLTFALGRCMSNPENIPTSDLISLTQQFEAEGTIDSTANLADDNVYIFHGSTDDVIMPEAADTIADYYNYFGSTVTYEAFTGSGHAQPTVNEGNLCSTSEDPYINRCNFDGAYEAMNAIYGGNLVAPDRSVSVSPPGELRTVDQTQFVPGFGGPGALSLADEGFLYIPTGCDGTAPCKLHIALHGCLMNHGLIGDDYIQNSGYNEVGELNNIAIFYPQTIRSFTVPYNPNGCWDWWGYNDPISTSIYHTQLGDQMQALKAMIDCFLV